MWPTRGRETRTTEQRTLLHKVVVVVAGGGVAGCCCGPNTEPKFHQERSSRAPISFQLQLNKLSRKPKPRHTPHGTHQHIKSGHRYRYNRSSSIQSPSPVTHACCDMGILKIQEMSIDSRPAYASSVSALTELRARLLPENRIGAKSRNPHASSAHDLQLKKVLSDLFKHGESNTLVVYGPPSSGKTSFLEGAIQQAVLECKDYLSSARPTIIRLNGVIHGDLKTCIEAVCFTLDLEHELQNFVTNEVAFEERLTDVLEFLRNSLATASSTNPIIFILDKIELFCEHPGQALLYNLFDIVQSKVSPVCVIGVTSGQDILELFEKRVKSRFSHRMIHLEALTLVQFEEAARVMLSVENNTEWQAQLDAMLRNEVVKEVLKSLHSINPNIGNLNIFLYVALLNCNERQGLSVAVFEDTFETMFDDSVTGQTLDLTIGELLMLKAVQKLLDSQSRAFNFEQLFGIVGRPSILEKLKVDRTDLLRSMQALEMGSMITPIDKKNDKSQVHYKSELLSHQFDRIFKKYPNVPTVFQAL